MTMFTFNGTSTTVYIDLGGKNLVAEPGVSYDLDSAPDALWSISAKASQSVPEADSRLAAANPVPITPETETEP